MTLPLSTAMRVAGPVTANVTGAEEPVKRGGCTLFQSGPWLAGFAVADPAMELEAASPRVTVVLLGGTLRPLQHSLVEPMASLILEQINVHTLFLGCNGVDAVGGVTNVNLPEAEVKKRMLKAAHRVVVLADGSKIGRTELAHLCPIERVDLVITGESADPLAVEELRKRDCEVRIVS